MARPCLACGAPIVWFKTLSGKSQPFDARPDKRGVIDETVPVGMAPVVRMVDTYMPHHATCPHADRFRKKGTHGSESGSTQVPA